MRLGDREQQGRLRELAQADPDGLPPRYLRYAQGRETPAELERVAGEFEAAGRLPVAIDAYTQAAHGYAGQGRPDSARRCRAMVSTLRQRCPGLHLAAAGQDDLALTPREREVARLALAGLTNREIAEKMGIAKRTVDNHLARAYTRLGIGTRAELSRFLDP